MNNKNKTAWDTKDFVVCETNLGKLRSELKAAQERIEKMEAALKLSIYRACVHCSADRIAYEALRELNEK
jgi:hypothetical protein